MSSASEDEAIDGLEPLELLERLERASVERSEAIERQISANGEFVEPFERHQRSPLMPVASRLVPTRLELATALSTRPESDNIPC
jgi:hypothetical protein